MKLPCGFLALIMLFSSVIATNAPVTKGAGLTQLADVTGSYVYKNYRKGKGGYENHLEITKAPNGRVHVSFELTYFYMAGKAETFHEGSAEGDGTLRGNLLSVTLSDGASGSCRMTLTFAETLLAGEYTVTVKSSRCEINVVPDGVYRKKASSSAASGSATPLPSAPRTGEVCPDPKAPCKSAAKEFAPFEMPFRLPGKLAKGKTYKSAPFYAVLLKIHDDETCDADDHTESIERERLQIQSYYPHNKVFALYSCPNLDAVEYSFPGLMDPTGQRALIMTFIAVYAGKTSAEGNQFLQYVRTVYPKASLKLMTASYEIIDQ